MEATCGSRGAHTGADVSGPGAPSCSREPGVHQGPQEVRQAPGSCPCCRGQPLPAVRVPARVHSRDPQFRDRQTQWNLAFCCPLLQREPRLHPGFGGKLHTEARSLPHSLSSMWPQKGARPHSRAHRGRKARAGLPALTSQPQARCTHTRTPTLCCARRSCRAP